MSISQISATDAFDLLKQDKNSVLIDVRTFEEFNFVGTVDASEFSGRMILNPWKLTVAMKENPEFANNLEEMTSKRFGKNNKTAKLLFMCRSGGRSEAAARFATEAGFINCFNVMGGFEGELDLEEHRGKMNGWKAENLPWRQA